MTDTETHYAQIEKEALALTWACEKFSCYILGKHIVLETDHKPLVPILSYNHLDNLPPRVLRFRLRLMRFDYDVVHVPGKYLYTTDMLSRSPLQNSPDENTLAQQQEVEYFIQAVSSHLPASETHLNTYRQGQADDATVSKIITYCQSGWPQKNQISEDLRPYWAIRGELSLYDNLLLYGSRIVIPPMLHNETLAKIHQGHQGIQRCLLRIKSSVWWPGVSQTVETFVKHCSHCQKMYVPPKEPLISSTLPNSPWNRVATDLFELNNTHYLAVVDYFSRYPEVCQLQSTTSASVVKALKFIFARHGIPSVLFSDNGPQFNSTAFKEFSSLYHFQHITSSPQYPQSNGLAERTVKTVKALLTGASDPYLALLCYRATPLPWCSISPVELLFGHKIATNIPQPDTHLLPDWPYLKAFQQADSAYKSKQQTQFNRRHCTRPLSELPPHTLVWVRTGKQQEPGQIITKTTAPRSYIMETATGRKRRNRHHLAPRLENS